MGHWITLEIAWWETNVVNCSFCGQMIPREAWVSELNRETSHLEEPWVFCSPECEQLYVDYWVPKHGYTLPAQSRSSN